LISLAIYGYEMAYGIQLWFGSPGPGALTGLLELLLGAYAIGLGRAWELLGAPRLGWTGWIGGILERLRENRPSAQEPPKS
jgi:hypothetical protein